MGASNAGGVGRNRYSESISDLTACVNEDSTRRFVLLKLTTDRHEASRGLFATADSGM